MRLRGLIMSISKVWYVSKTIQCIVRINSFEEQRHARTVFVRRTSFIVQSMYLVLISGSLYCLNQAQFTSNYLV